MYTRLIGLLLLFIFQINLAQDRGKRCLTPNNEAATCRAVDDCSIIYEALKSEDSIAIQFAKDSQCGYDDKPLVCCGSAAFPTPTATSSIFKIFKKPEVNANQPVILSNFDSKSLPDRTQCGLEKESKRVYGGSITELDEFPWMAALEYKSKFTGISGGIRCGGSLINTRYVLTAAHCLNNVEFEVVSVSLGEWRISTDPDCIEAIAISECSYVTKLKVQTQILHPYYSPATNNNDIALLQLDSDVTFTDYIRPICLPPIDLPNPEFNTLVTVAGWGVTENNRTSDVKLKVRVPLLPNERCREILTKPISSNQLCAGGEQGRDTCEGDSGSPLMRMYEDQVQTQWYQEGVVSYGLGCGRRSAPAVYTRISRYVAWIINTISEEEE